MESLYVLVPLSVLLVLGAIGVFAWAVLGGQFDDLAQEGERVLFDDAMPSANAMGLDVDQIRSRDHHQE